MQSLQVQSSLHPSCKSHRPGNMEVSRGVQDVASLNISMGLPVCIPSGSAGQEAVRPAGDCTGGMQANTGIPSSAWSTAEEWSVRTQGVTRAQPNWSAYLSLA